MNIWERAARGCSAGGWRPVIYVCVLAVMGLAAAPHASATAVISLTQATPCPLTNGNGGDWCQANGGPAFNLSSFTTQSIGPAGTVGSAAFFAITNNTGMTVTSLTLDFVGTITIPPVPEQCGGGGTGIQGSGPNPMTGTAGCAITQNSKGFAVTWTNIDWANKATFDLQIASFSAVGTQGVFETPPSPTPEPTSLLLLGSGLLGLGIVVRRRASVSYPK